MRSKYPIYYHLAFVLSLVLSLTSCLKEELLDRSEEESIYTDANSIYTNAVAGLYNYIGGSEDSQGLQGTRAGVYDYNTFTTDEAIIPIRGGDWYDGGVWQRMHLHTWTPDESALYQTWTYLYKMVMLCNKSIRIIENHGEILTDKEAREYKSEVRAIRAMYYWYLMDMFGRVPLVTSADATLDDCVQSERSEVWKFCVSELQDVAGNLYSEGSGAKPGNGYGRLTAHGAYFILAKLMINAEVYCDDDWTDGVRPDGKDIMVNCDGEEMNVWQACELYCKKVGVGKNGNYIHGIEQSFADNFSLNNKTSAENIFVIPTGRGTYKVTFTNLMRSLHYNHAAVYGLVGLNGPSATKKAMRVFGYDKGPELCDPRLPLTFYCDTVMRYDEEGNVIDTVRQDSGKPLVYYPMEIAENLSTSKRIQTAGARFRKYAIDEKGHSDGNMPNNDIVLFRFADVMLMLSEAMVRTGNPLAKEYLNSVRLRVDAGDVEECTLETILDERMLELAWEGWRRQDLVRFNLFHKAYGDERTPLPNEEATAYTTVFPIPKRCIDLNPKLTQNKGY